MNRSATIQPAQSPLRIASCVFRNFAASLPVALLAIPLFTSFTAARAAAAEPVLRLRADGAFDVAAARAGDTVTYRLRVAWNEIPAAVMLSPREVLDASGLTPAGRAVMHARTTENGEVVNRTEFTYALVAREPGTARVLPHTLRYLNGLTGREEELAVPGATLRVEPAASGTFGAGAVRIGAGVGALAAGLALIFLLLRGRLGRFGRFGRSSRALQTGGAPSEHAAAHGRPEPESATLSATLRALRARADGADGRIWIRDAERVCTEWLCARVGITHPENVRFEAALNHYLGQYLGRSPVLSPSVTDGWTKLRDLFHEARFGAYSPEPHECHEICRHMKNCLTSPPDSPSG